MRYKYIFFIIFIFCIFVMPVRADEKNDQIAELQKKIAELTKQAEQYKGTVLEKQKEANTLQQQIAILNNQIGRLESELGITEKRIETSKIQLTDLQGKLFITQQNIQIQKIAIGEAIQYMDQQDRASLLAKLFKNKNVSDFANEAQHMATLQEKLYQDLLNLKEEKSKLEDQKKQIESKKSELEHLSEQQEQQKISLSGNKSTKAKLLKDTKGQESQYQKMLTEVERKKAEFFSELLRLENAAVANGTVITHIKATAVPPRGTKIFNHPYHDKAYTTQGYGMTSYAKKGAYGGAGHNGWDTASGCGSPIFSIGTGTILASGTNAGFGNWVAIKHDGGGGMVSVYAHMQRGTHLAIGTRVTSDTTIGFEGTTGNSTGCHLHLSLYREFFTYINTKNNQLYFNYMDGSVNPLDYIQ